MVLRICKICKIEKEEHINFYFDKNLSRYKVSCKNCLKERDVLKHKQTYIPHPRSALCKEESCSSLKVKGSMCNEHYRRYKRTCAQINRLLYPKVKKQPNKCLTSDCLASVGHSSIYKLCRTCYKQKFADKIKEQRSKSLKEKRSLISNKCKQRYHNDILFKLKAVLRSRLNVALKKNLKTGSAVSDLGCSTEKLKKYLESQFKPGMFWDNWGRGNNKWHIDHIKPLSSFDLNDPEEFKRACHYTNLQPLWEIDNLKKGSSYGVKD